MAKIEPEVGRIVWYRPSVDDAGPHGCHASDQPLAAQIAGVNEDGTINLGILASDGTPYARQNVPLLQDGDEAIEGSFAEWVPHPKEKTKK